MTKPPVKVGLIGSQFISHIHTLSLKTRIVAGADQGGGRAQRRRERAVEGAERTLVATPVRVGFDEDELEALRTALVTGGREPPG